jgi:hypothetical protein
MSGVCGAHRLDKVENPLADRRIGNPIIGPDQLQRFPPAEGIVAKRILRFRGAARTPIRQPTETRGQAVGHVVEKEADRDVENPRQIEQARRANPIDAAFILLHLLEGQSQSFAKPLLAHAQQGAAEANAGPHMHIDWTGTAFSFTAQYLFRHSHAWYPFPVGLPISRPRLSHYRRFVA